MIFFRVLYCPRINIAYYDPLLRKILFSSPEMLAEIVNRYTQTYFLGGFKNNSFIRVLITDSVDWYYISLTAYPNSCTSVPTPVYKIESCRYSSVQVEGNYISYLALYKYWQFQVLQSAPYSLTQ